MRKKIRFRLRLLWHGLMSRWMLILCMIIIPINVFSIAAVYAVGKAYQENLAQSFQSQLDIFTRQVDYYNRKLQDAYISNVIVNNIYELSKGDATDSIMTDLRIKASLSNLSYDPYSFTSCYLYDKTKDFVTFFNAKSDLSDEVKQRIEQLVQDDAIRYIGEYHPFSADGHMYIAIRYEFPYFSFGYFINVDSLLQKFYENSNEFIGSVYYMDSSDNVITSYPKTEAIEVKELELNQKGDIYVSADMESVDYKIVYRIRASEVRRLYPPIVYLFYLFAFISIAVLPLLYILARRLIMRPLYALAEAMKAVEEGNLDYRVPEHYGTYQMSYIAKSFNHMVKEINHMTIASYEQEIGKLQTETINANLQVNQHMLLNSLNLVYSLILTKRYEEAAEFTILLIKYFQYALRKNYPIVTVYEEITFIKDYLRLQKIRLTNKFTSACAVSEDSKGLEIPQLLIQGFVENAIKYALSPDYIIEILINVQKVNGRLCISITDTGVGIDEEILRTIQEGRVVENTTGKHVGFWNARKRLDYYYGEDYELNIISKKGQGTQIYINLPEHPIEKEKIARSIRKKEQIEENWSR